MSKFLEVELTPNQYGGGSFNCKAGFRLDNLASSFQNIDVKIDTGCSISTIPVKKLKVSDRICKSLKEADINSNVISVRSYGIETGGVFHPEPITSSGNILIGMDILSLMINHIDVSRKTGVLTLLCCPRESADADFYFAMREHFGLIQM